MNPQYLTFQKFNDEGSANELAELFSDNRIDFIENHFLSHESFEKWNTDDTDFADKN